MLRLQDVQQELLDVTWGELVDVLRWQVSRADLQLMFHRLDDPTGNTQSSGKTMFAVHILLVDLD